jgi:hypothetical protein
LPTRRFLKPGDYPQERRFSTAGRTNENDEFSIFNLKIYTLYDLRCAKPFLDCI